MNELPKTLIQPLMQDHPSVPVIIIGINLLVLAGLVYFGAPVWVLAGDGILCLLLIALQVWLLRHKPEQRLILREDSLTFVGIWSETTLSFAEIAIAELGPTPEFDSHMPVLFLSNALGRSILIHPGFLQPADGVIPFVETRLAAHGKVRLRPLRK